MFIDNDRFEESTLVHRSARGRLRRQTGNHEVIGQNRHKRRHVAPGSARRGISYIGDDLRAVSSTQMCLVPPYLHEMECVRGVQINLSLWRAVKMHVLLPLCPHGA